MLEPKFQQDSAGAVNRPISDKLREFVSVLDFGADPTGVADSTTAIQNAINFAAGTKAVYFPAGIYRVSALTYPVTGLVLRGDYPLAVIRHSNPAAQSLLQSAAFGTVTPYVSINGLVFDGNNATLASNVAMVRIAETTDVRVNQCKFTNYNWTMLSLIGCPSSRVDQCAFNNWGSTDPGNTSSTPGIYIGPNQVSGTGADESHVTNSEFRNGRWVGIYCYSRKAVLSFNEIHDCREAGIFSFRERPGDPATADAEDLIVIGNNISNITAQYISATGMEIGAVRSVVMGNVIENCESSGIKVLDVGQRVLVSGNVVENTVRDPVVFPSHGQIEVVVSNVTTLKPAHVQITNNIVTDTALPKLAPYAISARRYDGAETIDTLRIIGNDVFDGFVTSDVFITAGLVNPGGEVLVVDNLTRGGLTTEPNHILRRDGGGLFYGVDVDDDRSGGFQFYKDGVLRWELLVTPTETLEIRRYDASGVFQATTLQAQPTTNGVTYAGRVTALSFSTNGALILSGTGSPEGVAVAGVGSIYQRTDGGAGTSFYVKESGTGAAGWVAK
jgi:hypothetical protein